MLWSATFISGGTDETDGQRQERDHVRTLRAHFIALGYPNTVSSVARTFTDIVCLHGFPSSIVNYCDSVFTGHVWRDFFKLAGVKLSTCPRFKKRFKTTFNLD